MIATVAMLAGTAIAGAPMSVAALVQHHAALTGRTVQVTGILGRCEQLSCGIHDEVGRSGQLTSVSFGGSAAFDASVQGLAGRRVIVEAVVTDTCWPRRTAAGEAPPCTDWAAQLVSPRLVRMLDGRDR